MGVNEDVSGQILDPETACKLGAGVHEDRVVEMEAGGGFLSDAAQMLWASHGAHRCVVVVFGVLVAVVFAGAAWGGRDADSEDGEGVVALALEVFERRGVIEAGGCAGTPEGEQDHFATEPRKTRRFTGRVEQGEVGRGAEWFVGEGSGGGWCRGKLGPVGNPPFAPALDTVGDGGEVGWWRRIRINAGELRESVGGPDAGIEAGGLSQEESGGDDNARFRIGKEAHGDGDVVGIDVVRSCGLPAADKAAMDYVLLLRWIPGTVDGVPRSMRVILPMTLDAPADPLSALHDLCATHCAARPVEAARLRKPHTIGLMGRCNQCGLPSAARRGVGAAFVHPTILIRSVFARVVRTAFTEFRRLAWSTLEGQ